jgi:predicted DCC family thiol-disulfide oxidoreductase YuxK
VISIQQIKESWNRFFFKPESPLPIAIYRCLLGLLVLANNALVYPDLFNFYGQRGIITPETALKLSGGTGLNVFRHLPQNDTSLLIVFSFCCLAAFTLAIGFWSRLSALVVFVTFTSICHRNPILLNSGDSFLRIASFFIIFTPAGEAFSVDRLLGLARGKISGPPKPRAPWAMRLIQLQLSFVYLYAFVWKTMGAMWLSGTAVYYTSRLQEFWRFPVPYIFTHLWTMKLWAWSTLIIEFSLGVLVWIKELRYVVLIGGVLLHAGIDYSMNIPLFGFIMVAAYVTFIAPRDLESFWSILVEKFNRRSATSYPVPVFYDGKCSFCLRSMEIIRSLDILHRFAFFNMHSAKVQGDWPDLDQKRGEKELMIKTKEGWHGGFQAFRYMTRHLPIFWIVLPLLYLPMIRAAGDRLYKWIAGRRYCILQH